MSQQQQCIQLYWALCQQTTVLGEFYGESSTSFEARMVEVADFVIANDPSPDAVTIAQELKSCAEG